MEHCAHAAAAVLFTFVAALLLHGDELPVVEGCHLVVLPTFGVSGVEDGASSAAGRCRGVPSQVKGNYQFMVHFTSGRSARRSPVVRSLGSLARGLLGHLRVQGIDVDLRVRAIRGRDGQAMDVWGGGRRANNPVLVPLLEACGRNPVRAPGAGDSPL